jgi:hypothetical protein
VPVFDLRGSTPGNGGDLKAAQISTVAATHHSGGRLCCTAPPPVGVQTASLGYDRESLPGGSALVTSRAVRWVAASSCLDPALRRVITELAASFGPVTVNSTRRSATRNAAVGGARH